ncbi:hypothetical protein [Curtobacterium sp. PhB136]|uniref:hypothetical protein n=1 Tax=Curtobacterium sp. PhB136 TaxID=2485181 RepID=UPI00104F7229|nr:hypothetical protein [Curtobacterium sp. PhB136]
MPSVTVHVPISGIPDLFRRAVEAVPNANLIEVLPDRALVGRRTTVAIRSETTRFTFHAKGEGVSELRVQSTNGGVFGVARYDGVVLETGRQVLQELSQLDLEGSR